MAAIGQTSWRPMGRRGSRPDPEPLDPAVWPAVCWSGGLLGAFVGVVLGVLVWLHAFPAHARDTIQVPVTVHVATKDGRSVVNEQQIRASLRRANAELTAFDVELTLAAVVPMRGGAELETQDQRFRLGQRAAPDGSIHVFYVERVELDNPRKGDRRVSGMHWRYHGLDRRVRGREYLAVAHNAPTTTLVHEVGHAFGLAHAQDTDNLMCSCRRGLEPSFTPHQGRRLRRGAKRFLRRSKARAR